MMLTVPEAARRAGKNPETIRRWIRSGRIRSQKVGTQHLVDESELEGCLVEAEREPLPPEWRVMRDGRPQLDWVALVRESRASH